MLRTLVENPRDIVSLRKKGNNTLRIKSTSNIGNLGIIEIIIPRKVS